MLKLQVVWVNFASINRGGTGLDNGIMGAGVGSTNNGLHMGERQGALYFAFYGSAAGKYI